MCVFNPAFRTENGGFHMEKKTDLYSKYDAKKYVHYRQVRVGGADIQETKDGKKRVNPKMEKRKIPFAEIKSLRLDDYGTPIPQPDTEDFTIVQNYLLDFWGAIIGDAVNVYIHFKRYAYGKKDFCFPDIELIALKMNKSVNTIKKYIDILEEYHFVAKFNRYDATDNNRAVSPFFKIRRQIPLITADMYNELDPKLKKLHDEFMEEYRIETLDSELTEQQAVIDEMTVGREIVANKETRKKIEKVIKEHNNYEFIWNNIDSESKLDNIKFKKAIENKVSKPSFDTWFRDTVIFIKMQDYSWVVACANEFARDWLEERYDSVLRQILYGSPEGKLDIQYYTMDIVIERQFANRV